MEQAAWTSAASRVPLDGDSDSGNESFSCYHPLVVEYRYFAVLWGSLVTIAGTAGNLMTILAFATNQHLRTSFNALIVNLALADMMYCTLLPVTVDSYLHLRWRGGPLWCRTFGLLVSLSNSVSILTLCLIAVSRYLLVEKRAIFQRAFCPLGMGVLLPCTWALGLASFGPLWRVYVFVPQVCTCSFHRTRGRPYTSVLLFFYFFAGLFCVGVFYLLIYRRVRGAARALLRHRPCRRSPRKKTLTPALGTKEDSGVSSGGAHTCSSEISCQADLPPHRAAVTWDQGPARPRAPPSALASHAPGASTTEPATTSSATTTSTPTTTPRTRTTAAPPCAAQGSGDDREFSRVTRMCFTVFLCFVFCFAPFLLINVIDKGVRAPPMLHMFSANLTWLNSCINPLLYAIMNRQFRQSYHLLLTRAAGPLAAVWRR